MFSKMGCPSREAFTSKTGFQKTWISEVGLPRWGGGCYMHINVYKPTCLTQIPQKKLPILYPWCHPEISGYAGPWQSNPGAIDVIDLRERLCPILRPSTLNMGPQGRPIASMYIQCLQQTRHLAWAGSPMGRFTP